MQRVVDNVLGIAKESIKVFCQESLNNTLKFINGFSALILTIIPGKTSILEGVHGWELRPSFKAPRLPRWMDDGVSSFNQFIHEYTADSDIDSESEYESGQDDNDSAPPSSPSSQTSYVSRASSFRLERNNSHGSIVKRLISASIWPLRYLFGYSNHSLPTRPSRRKYSLQASISRGSSGSIIGMYDIASKRFMNMKDYVVHHLTDRRRGVIEDIQLLVELFIERVFELLRNVLLYIVSPFETFKLVIRKIIFRSRKDAETVTVHAANLGDTNPTPLRVQSSFRQEMNTDARTCEDIVTELGYPYESIRVVTQDGYILQMERIPRRDSQKVLFLQHGLLDSSVGWVSNGVVGSQAFAAYDQGYDVFLGNYRGLASREHVDKNISPQKYWNYSVNELGTQDIPAMLDKLNEIKLSELDVVSSEVEDSKRKQPYTLCGIAHSLGGAVMLMYVVTRRLKGMRHYLSRLILLSPAGFHKEAPLLCNLLQYILPAVDPLLSRIFPGIYIPTKFFRMLFNKLARDFQNYPALGGLVQTLISYILGGDSSNWIEAFGVTHYNMYDMPGVAFRVSVHLSQMKRADRFVMYDFGSASANMKVYGSPHPLDVGSRYDLIDIPVDFVGGLKDKLIPWSMIRRHYHLMKEKGCAVSYTESDYAHLDFIFAHREDLLAYVMSRLLLVKPPSNAKKVKTSYGRSTSRKDSKRSRNSKPSVILQTPKSPPDDVNAVSGVEACECMDSPSLLNPEADQSDEGEISVVH